MSTDPRAIIEQLWVQFRPLVQERVQLLEEYVAGRADQADAARAAHNLAGSLGSYGRAEASAVAREIDLALGSGGGRPDVDGGTAGPVPAVEPASLAGHVARLRDLLG